MDVKEISILWKNIPSDKIYNELFFENNIKESNFNYISNIGNLLSNLNNNNLNLNLDNNNIHSKIFDNIFSINVITDIKKNMLYHLKKLTEFDYENPIIINNDKKIFDTVCWFAANNIISILECGNINFLDRILFLNISYILTDSYFDDKNINYEDKKKFGLFCFKRLMGKSEGYDNITKKIDKNMSLFESKYSRDKYKKLYESINYLFTVEYKSMIEQDNLNLDLNKFLQLTILKGYSTSACILNLIHLNNINNLSINKIKFYYKLGFLIQLIDDICDLNKDIINRNNTYLSKILNLNQSIEKVVIKTFNFIDILAEELKEYDILNKNLDKTQSILNFKFLFSFLLCYGIAKNSKFYSKTFLIKIEKMCPVNFNHIFYARNNKNSFVSKIREYCNIILEEIKLKNIATC